MDGFGAITNLIPLVPILLANRVGGLLFIDVVGLFGNQRFVEAHCLLVFANDAWVQSY